MTTTDDPGGGDPGRGKKAPTFTEVVMRGSVEDDTGSFTIHSRATIGWPMASETNARQKPSARPPNKHLQPKGNVHRHARRTPAT
ncbi:MAG: hypothetical protein ACREBR_03945 [bacterium]